jgi:hypothetical protein
VIPNRALTVDRVYFPVNSTIVKVSPSYGVGDETGTPTRGETPLAPAGRRWHLLTRPQVRPADSLVVSGETFIPVDVHADTPE